MFGIVYVHVNKGDRHLNVHFRRILAFFFKFRLHFNVSIFVPAAFSLLHIAGIENSAP